MQTPMGLDYFLNISSSKWERMGMEPTTAGKKSLFDISVFIKDIGFLSSKLIRFGIQNYSVTEFEYEIFLDPYIFDVSNVSFKI